MAYKSVLTVVSSLRDCDAILEAAISFAAQTGAHLDVLTMAIDRAQPGYYVAGMGTAMQDASLAVAEEERGKIDAAVRAKLEPSDAVWAQEALVVPQVSVSAVVAARARFADLVLMAKPYGTDTPSDAPIALESAMFQGRAAVMLLPDGAGVPTQPNRVIVAWNESPEALTAVRAALPFIVAAGHVEILIIDPARHAPQSADPGAELAKMLARHGAEVSVAIVAQTLPRISDVISRNIEERGADLLVLGAYSHSRFREAILGGTTRNLLESAQVPVLMAH